MKKRLLAGVLTVIFVFAMVQQVSANTLSTDGGSTSVPVKYTVDNTAFMITIPAMIQAGTVESEFAISASGVNLRPDEHLEVAISSGCDESGVVKLERQNVPFGKTVASLNTILSVNGKNVAQSGHIVGYFTDSANSNQNLYSPVKLSPLVVNDTTEAGDYQAVLEFTITLKDNE